MSRPWPKTAAEELEARVAALEVALAKQLRMNEAIIAFWPVYDPKGRAIVRETLKDELEQNPVKD
jgi:hypothetical protein